MRVSIVFLSLLSILFSCTPDNNFPDPETELIGVDIQLQSYFNTFETEGRQRGVNLDLSEYELTGDISEIHQDNVAGQCQYSSNRPNAITIDKSFWKNASPMLREMVVFHELGHCVLARGHREASNHNGHCLSIMRSGTGSCSTLYNAENRKYYLDELFLYED